MHYGGNNGDYIEYTDTSYNEKVILYRSPIIINAYSYTGLGPCTYNFWFYGSYWNNESLCFEEKYCQLCSD